MCVHVCVYVHVPFCVFPTCSTHASLEVSYSGAGRSLILWEPQPLLSIVGIIRPLEEADFASSWPMTEVGALYGLAELVEEG